jgi:hypothetical protein
MTFHRSTFQKLAFSTFLLTSTLGSAWAQDTADVAGRLKALLANQGVDLAWTGISGDASSMVMQGVSIQPAGEKDPLPIGDVTLEGVTEENGGYAIESVATQPFSHNEDGVSVEASPLVIHDLTVPAESGTDPLASLLMYKSAKLESMSVKVGDKQAFAMDNLSVEITPPADGKAMEFSGGVEKFTGDLTLIDDPKSKAAIDAMGYQTVSGNMEVEGSWQPSDGKMELSQYAVTVDDAGTFGMTFGVSGYTLDFVKSLQDLQKKMAAQPEGADKSAQGMAMLGLMQQLTFNGASIRFDDDSLTNKILDYVGKQQGMSAKDIANQAKAVVPFGMAQLDNPELAAQVTAAINAYLDDPKSLEIDAEPDSPTPFAAIMAGAMSNPAGLTKTLGVSVTANED